MTKATFFKHMPVQTRSMTRNNISKWHSDYEEPKVHPIYIIKRELGYKTKVGEHLYCVQVGSTIEWLPKSSVDKDLVNDFDKQWSIKSKTTFDKARKCYVCIL